jgi:hypothetical protein
MILQRKRNIGTRINTMEKGLRREKKGHDLYFQIAQNQASPGAGWLYICVHS